MHSVWGFFISIPMCQEREIPETHTRFTILWLDSNPINQSNKAVDCNLRRLQVGGD